MLLASIFVADFFWGFLGWSALFCCCFLGLNSMIHMTWDKTTSALCTCRFLHPHTWQDQEFHLQQESSLDSLWDQHFPCIFTRSQLFSPPVLMTMVVWPSSLSSSYNNLLDKTFQTIAPAKNLIASNDASETKVLPNDLFSPLTVALSFHLH